VTRTPTSARARLADVTGELAKLPAFVRRDFLVMWSYRLAFFADWVNLIIQVTIFYFVGRLVDASQLPSYGDGRSTYIEFVSVGIALTSLLQLALAQVVTSMNSERMMGTLEALMVTPTSPSTVQLGLVMYEAIYVPIRTSLFLVAIALMFDVSFHASGFAFMLLILAVLMPVIWGLGVLTAAANLTYRRSASAVGLGMTVLTVASGAYFPVGLLPGWMRPLVEANPIAIALEATRQTVVGGAGLDEVLPAVLKLIPMAIVSLALGFLAFRAALERERRSGNLGLY
jgi:ABC-2 type transport system permease protein